MAFCSYYNTFKKKQMFYYKFLIASAAAFAIIGFIYMARKPENAAFRFFDKDIFIVCSLAAALMLAPFFIADTHVVNGSKLMFAALWILGLAAYIFVGVYNVRRTSPVFGVIATFAQIAVFGAVFPLLVGWGVLKFIGSILTCMGSSDDYDNVSDPDGRFGVSEDERRGEGLYTPDKVTPKSF